MMARFFKQACFGILLLGLAAGCSTTPAPYGVVANGPISVVGPGGDAIYGMIRHVVGPSENLYRIAKSYGVDMQSILDANQIRDPNLIRSGQTLKIPNARAPKPIIPLYPSRKWTHIIIHHTATDQGDAYSIDRMHHQRGFWNGMGYHFLINNGTQGKMDGQIQVGPRWVKQQDGAHTNADNMNKRGIGIAVVGNFSEQYMTEFEFNALAFLVQTLRNYYEIPEQNIIGHGDVRGARTECPGKWFPWESFRKAIS